MGTMWRAWGIALLLLSSQDLAPRVASPDHEFAFRPPQGWVRHVGAGPTLVKFTEPGDHKLSSELLVTHLHSSNPTAIDSFRQQAKDHIKDKYPGARIIEEKDLVLAGKKAFRIVFSNSEYVWFKTAVHRNNLEFYLLDAVYPPDRADKIRPVVEASVATFEIIPQPLSAEEKAADARTSQIVKSGKIVPSLLGERWFSIHLQAKKIGWMRFKMTESEGLYAFESEVRTDLGENNTDGTVTRGSFAPDGRVQKVETEQTKVNPKQKWVFKASTVLERGQVKSSRDLNGIKEEKSFTVEDGVLIADVAEILRTSLVRNGKGSYLLKTLSPYSEEWVPEVIDVGGLESLEVNGGPADCMLVQAYVGRRKNMTYYYAPDLTVLRVGGPRDPFVIRASTKDDAQK